MHETLQHIDELQTELIEHHGLEQDEIEGLNLDDLEALHRRMEKTEELRKGLREEYDIPDEELDKRDLEELQELHDHLQEIEQQRNELLSQYGLGDDEEQQEEDDQEADEVRPEVQDLSDQIKKLRGRPDRDDIDDDDIDTDTDTDKEVEKGKSLMDELDIRNLKKEYEHEIEDRDEDFDDGEGEDIQQPSLMDRIRGFFGSSSSSSDGQTSVYDAAKANLSRAQEIEGYEESTVLLAHTLKQFLELKLHVRKEMTYMEFIRTLEKHEDELEQQLSEDDVDELKRFFRKMHLQQYKGEKKVDFRHASELANATIDAFAE